MDFSKSYNEFETFEQNIQIFTPQAYLKEISYQNTGLVLSLGNINNAILQMNLIYVSVVFIM